MQTANLEKTVVLYYGERSKYTFIRVYRVITNYSERNFNISKKNATSYCQVSVKNA
jgi:hypothetical protein